MKAFRRLSIAIPALLLIASWIGIYLTRGAMANLPFLNGGKTRTLRGPAGIVDQRPWQTIEALAPLAVSAEEKRLAREAQRVADHEVDQAFAQALREASLETRTLTGEALKFQERIASLQATVKDDQAKVTALTTAQKADPQISSDDLDTAKAQLQLDSDELNDSTEDLARLTGDRRGQIQQELNARETAMKKYDQQNGEITPAAVQSAQRYRTLSGRVSALMDQRSRMESILQAKTEAEASASELAAQHDALEKRMSEVDAAKQQAPDTKTRLARLNELHGFAQVHSLLDDRVQAQKQLSRIYQQWYEQVKRQRGIVLHMALGSVAAIAFLLLCGGLLTAGIGKALDRMHLERRNRITLRTIATLAVQVVIILLALLVVFGAPSQLPTIIGIATAGLTVVFQGFILAFFGWFILMGKNGIRVGDWVEINGVGGEVVEVGVFRTTLLETGNWTDRGHPTGRRVQFMNSFAISGQYFNFSTLGQWLWEEIHITLPSRPDTYRMIEAIHKAVEQETTENAKLAEAEWKRSSQAQGLSQFSAQPSVDLRPAGSGVEVVVRYVTRAGDRFASRNKLNQMVLNLMQKDEKETPELDAGEKH